MIAITWKMQGGNIVVSDNHYVENAGGKYMVSDYHMWCVITIMWKMQGGICGE